MARRKDGGHGGHGWFVTFADLMALLVAFFVMLSALSTQDQQKMQLVAGSMRDAFGVQSAIRYSGIVEVPGLPTRPKLKNAANIPPEEASATPSPDQHDRNSIGVRSKQDRAFALAAASLRQALQDMPELTEVSKHVMIEETRDGLNVEIVDQDGRSMFPEGSSEPYERTRRLIQRLAVPLKATGFRISITGHTSATRTPFRPGYGPWELSSERAHAVRRTLEAEGVPSAVFFGVTGKADVQLLFPDDPYVSANRRITISLISEEPPIPFELKH